MRRIDIISQKQETDLDQWKKIAEQTKKVRIELFKLMDELNTRGDVPGTIWNRQFNRALDSIDKMRSDLEDRFSEESPEDFDSSIFY